MRILLDTHCWLWLQVEPERLRDTSLELVENRGNELLLSAASSWEIAVKHALGRLPLPEPPATYVPSRMASSGVAGLPVEHIHALRVAELPPLHRDPFDRLLVAQAREEKLTLLTADPRILAYDVDCIEA